MENLNRSIFTRLGGPILLIVIFKFAFDLQLKDNVAASHHESILYFDYPL